MSKKAIWEVYTITIKHNGDASDAEVMDQETTTGVFENKLLKLVKSHQGEDGLTFEVTDSEDRTLTD